MVGGLLVQMVAFWFGIKAAALEPKNPALGRTLAGVGIVGILLTLSVVVYFMKKEKLGLMGCSLSVGGGGIVGAFVASDIMAGGGFPFKQLSFYKILVLYPLPVIAFLSTGSAMAARTRDYGGWRTILASPLFFETGAHIILLFTLWSQASQFP